jgi:hypothetical protein
MKVVGVIATGIVGLVALIGVLVGVRSIPEVKRYVRMRSM